MRRRYTHTNCNCGILYIVISWPVGEMDLSLGSTHRRVPALCENRLTSSSGKRLRACYHTPCAVHVASPAEEWSEGGPMEGESHIRIFWPSDGGTVPGLLKGSGT
jgi:hypothetical protein